VTLRADIFRPGAPGKYPVLLQRTPYNRAASPDFSQEFDFRAAARGYIVVVQDCRGRYGSEGEWYPFKHEAQDGYDTIEWAAALPYANGKVGMFGGSGEGISQMQAAITSPPHLAGLFPFITASNYHDGWTYQGGAFELWFNQNWVSGLLLDTLSRRALKEADPTKGIAKLPVSSYPPAELARFDDVAPYYADWLAHPSYDDYWKQWSVEENYSRIMVPAFYLGNWYDIFLGGTLRNFLGTKSHGGSEAARNGQRLLVVVGTHISGGRKIGDVDFGPEALNGPGLFDLVLRWYDYILKGVANGMDREKPVKFFVMGRNQWKEEDQWPPASAVEIHYYLRSGGSANSLSGDGRLSTEAPSDESPDHFVFDPADPVPTRGGNLCCDALHFPPGPFDQRPNETRPDVLVYSTPPLKKDVEVTGPVSVDLYVGSSAVDTDFTGKLVDVWPDGFAQNITDGILRARYRNSPEKAEFMNPGDVYRLRIDLWATSNVFKAGHQVRLEISSSNFPRFDRNLNTGENPGLATRMAKASNSVFHDRDHSSAIVLSVVPNGVVP
jgi:putative CocE/NonD family hydrolase